MKRIVTIIGLALAAAFAGQAQNNEAFGWMAGPGSPVSAGMAGATLASYSDGTYIGFTNPASMPFTNYYGNRLSAAVSTTGPEKGYNVNAGYVFGDRFGIALAASRISGGEYEVMDDSGNSQGMFKTALEYAGISAGYRIIDDLSIGLSLELVSEKLSPDDGIDAFAADFFAMYRIRDFAVSAGVSNLGTAVRDAAGTSFGIPASARAGAGYAKTFAGKHSVEAEIDADYYFSRAFSAAAGVQYGWNDIVFARAGYRFSTGTCTLPSHASVGLGAKYFGFRIDAAYCIASGPIDDYFSFGFGFAF